VETTRRGFLQAAAATGAAPFLPSRVDAQLAHANMLAQATGGDPWWKMQTHAHANPEVVGPYAHLPRSTPHQVIEWYQLHGHFHAAVAQIGLNVHTPVGVLSELCNLPGQFLVVPSEEDSRIPDGLAPDGIAAKGRILDTLALFNEKPTPQEAIPDTGATVRIYSATREAIESVGGLASLAHPLLTYAARAQELIRSRPARGVSFFEVWNGEPGIPQLGGGGEPSTDQLWDAVLSTGKRMYATAGDDGFPTYPIDAVRPGSANWNAGRAWIVVRAPELSLAALKKAMLAGSFYASTGVIVDDYQVDGGKITITLPKQDNSFHWSDADHNPTLFTTLFYGRDGKVLKEDTSLKPTYTAKSTDLYVRPKVVSSCNHEVAWFQPVFR
jgi:hypothetical protein